MRRNSLGLMTFCMVEETVRDTMFDISNDLLIADYCDGSFEEICAVSD